MPTPAARGAVSRLTPRAHRQRRSLALPVLLAAPSPHAKAHLLPVQMLLPQAHLGFLLRLALSSASLERRLVHAPRILSVARAETSSLCIAHLLAHFHPLPTAPLRQRIHTRSSESRKMPTPRTSNVLTMASQRSFTPIPTRRRAPKNAS